MSKVIVVTRAAATARLSLRCIAKTECDVVTSAWDWELTDAANYRYAANAMVAHVNSSEYNILHSIKYEIVAGGIMPDGISYGFIMSE